MKVTHTQQTNHHDRHYKSAKWFSGSLFLSSNLLSDCGVFEIILFFLLIYFTPSLCSTWKDRRSCNKMRNKAKPLQTRIHSGLSLLRITKKIHHRNSQKLSSDKFVEIHACEYSISKIELLLLPTVYSSYVKCLAAIADLNIFAWRKKRASLTLVAASVATSWKTHEWGETVFLRLVCEYTWGIRVQTIKWNLDGNIKENSDYLQSGAPNLPRKRGERLCERPL